VYLYTYLYVCMYVHRNICARNSLIDQNNCIDYKGYIFDIHGILSHRRRGREGRW